jgi:chemotaxis protein MotB
MSGGRGHVGRSKRRRAAGHGEHGDGGHERWLVTYADMLTLLLVLFIVLFSISIVNTSKFIALSQSLSNAFGSGHRSVLDGGDALLQSSAGESNQQILSPGQPVQPQIGQTGAIPKVGKYDTKVLQEVKDFRRIKQTIQDALKAKGLTSSAQFAVDRRGLVITVLTNEVVFPGNSATLLAGGKAILSVIAPPLRHNGHNIEVDGFTNQAKVSTYPYPTGWELSSARASAVVRYLISAGIAGNRLSAVGWSDQKPLLPPSDPRSVTRNRRVEIVVLTTLSPAVQDELPDANADISD